MGISKALRYQVMRRDGHACTYCGARPPDARLVIDHVVPVALGGSDSPDNLTTACNDCNSGKGANPVDAAVVESVAETNTEFRRVMQQLAEDAASVDERCTEFLRIWEQYDYNYMMRRQHFPLPDTWERSVSVWLDRGLVIEDIEWAVHKAMDHPAAPDQKFRYMAGVLWRLLTERQEQAAEAMRQAEG